MDFARKQLEKYGWTDGKGLGKHENGISEALKPKLKRSVAGVGHDPAAEFNEHWWTTLYDKAAANVEVKEKNGKTKKIKRKDGEEFVITNSTWKLNKKKDTDNDEQYSEHFVRTAVLTNGANKVERVIESESEGEEVKRDVVKMTDEELFAACEGRTAHKGARHGLLATGKLARIAQQEALLLSQPKYNGYSYAKKLKEKVEEINLNSDTEVTERKKKKKKRKRCNSNENGKHVECDETVSSEMPLPVQEAADDYNIASNLKVEINSRKSKKKKKKDFRDIEVIPEEDEVSKPKKKKKEKVLYESSAPIEITSIEETLIEINK